jgi:hypothetical protein
MSLNVSSQNIIALVNTVSRVSINVTNDAGTLVDPDTLKLSIMDLGGNVLGTYTYPTDTRIVKDATGKFHFDWGSQMPNNETNVVCEWLFNWQSILVTGGDILNTVQKVKTISTTMASYIPEFRLMIDKAVKIVDVQNQCFLGYTDAHLVSFLEGGMANINAYQPSVTFGAIEQFPRLYKQILLDSGLITGVMSQQLFAIDTDIPNYNDQGTSFVISHQPQLASFLNQVTQRLDKMIPQMKLQLINSGSLHTTMGPGYRLQTIMEAAPSGSIFRNVFFVP